MWKPSGPAATFITAAVLAAFSDVAADGVAQYVALMTATDVIQALQLAPHPEGGWYREIYRSADRVQRGAESRSATTAIYYLARTTAAQPLARRRCR